MALVISFVADPAKGVAEMVRVVARGGLVATDAWDMAGGGFPMGLIQAEIRTIGLNPPLPLSAAQSRMEALRDLSTGAGLEAVEMREIMAPRTFADFDDFWTTSLMGAALASIFAAMAPADAKRSQSAGANPRAHRMLRGGLPTVRANAIMVVNRNKFAI